MTWDMCDISKESVTCDMSKCTVLGASLNFLKFISGLNLISKLKNLMSTTLSD